VPLAIATGLALLGHEAAAAVVVLVVVGFLQLARVDPGRARRLDQSIARAAAGLARVVGAAALAVVWGLLFVPVAALARLVRVDPLQSRPRWADRATAGAEAEDPFAPEPRAERGFSRTQRVATSVPLVVGWLTIALVANYAIGWAYDEVTDSHEVPSEVALAPSDDPANLLDRPALQDAPWAAAHLEGFTAIEYEYWPFLLQRMADGTYGDLHVEDHHRVTYEPGDLPADAPELWVLGGSTAFGLGQRDEHTVASELARRAEAAGIDLRVRNLSNPAYTSYQEWIRFEQALAEPGRPALAVFLDGTGDLEVQREHPSSDPTHFNRVRVDWTVTGRVEDVTGLRDLDDRYLDDSLLGRLWDGVSGLVGAQPAAAQEGPSIADNAADLGARARLLVEHLAERDGVPVLFVREPEPVGGPTRSAYRSVTAAIDEPVVDLSGLLAGREDLYLDWIHVNEEGAALIADALWPEVAARLG
jgi:hypothetical protein